MTQKFKNLENELKKRWQFPYRWGRRQTDVWDQKTNFIYSTFHFDQLLTQIQIFDSDLKDYALNRWYNFWSAMGVEAIFKNHPDIQPNTNKFDKLVDFKIKNIPFDHKTSVFPKGFNKSIHYAQNHKPELIKWFYLNQSQQGRKHLKNRLFVVLYSTDKKHWKLKAEMSLLENTIKTYLKNYDEKALYTIKIENETILSDIIFVIQ